MYSPCGILNALTTTLHKSIRTTLSIHHLQLGLLRYLIPFAPLIFVFQCQCWPNRVFSLLAFFPILHISSFHQKFPLPLSYSSSIVSTTYPRLNLGIWQRTLNLGIWQRTLNLGIWQRTLNLGIWQWTLNLGIWQRTWKTTYKFLHLIILDNACIFCLTTTISIKLTNAYFLDTVIASSLRKAIYNMWTFYLHATLLHQAFTHCEKFPTTISHRSPGRVSVPVWLIILSNQLLVIPLVSHCLTN